MLKWIKYSFVTLAKKLKDVLQQNYTTTILEQRDLSLLEFQEKINTILRLQFNSMSLELLQQHIACFELLIKPVYHLLYQYHKLLTEEYHSTTSAKVTIEIVIYLVNGMPYLTDVNLRS